MNQTEKIVITGIGAVTPIGIGVPAFWDNLTAGKCGIRSFDRFRKEGLPVSVAAVVEDFIPENYMPKKLARTSSRFAQFAYAAADEALSASGLDIINEAERIGISMGTALGGVSVTAETQAKITASGRNKVSPRFVPQILGNVAASQIAIGKGIRGPCYTMSTACSSGADAIGMACMLLCSSAADAVVTVAADSAHCPAVISSLAAAQALSVNPDPLMASRPFDQERNGFVMGEGSGAMILELESHAVKRKANILGIICGVSNNTDGYDVVAPAPDGHGEVACMKDAISQAGLNCSDIGYINAHGTSTLIGDEIECRAIQEVFGDNTPMVSSTKGSTGHMMGAGGIVEAIICLLALQKGLIPHTRGCVNPDPACCADLVMDHPRAAKINYAMSNSFGFGGQNASVVIGTYQSSTREYSTYGKNSK